jgi:hypothetical protein
MFRTAARWTASGSVAGGLHGGARRSQVEAAGPQRRTAGAVRQRVEGSHRRGDPAERRRPSALLLPQAQGATITQCAIARGIVASEDRRSLFRECDGKAAETLILIARLIPFRNPRLYCDEFVLSKAASWRARSHGVRVF